MRLIRDTYRAFNEGRLDRVADRLPGDFELVGTAGFGMGPFVGAEAVSRWFAEMVDAWETVRVDVEEVLEFDERVVVLGRIRGRGRGSGLEVDVVAAHLWTVQNGVPVRAELIGDREEALRRGAAEASS